MIRVGRMIIHSPKTMITVKIMVAVGVLQNNQKHQLTLNTTQIGNMSLQNRTMLPVTTATLITIQVGSTVHRLEKSITTIITTTLILMHALSNTMTTIVIITAKLTFGTKLTT